MDFPVWMKWALSLLLTLSLVLGILKLAGVSIPLWIVLAPAVLIAIAVAVFVLLICAMWMSSGGV